MAYSAIYSDSFSRVPTKFQREIVDEENRWNSDFKVTFEILTLIDGTNTIFSLKKKINLGIYKNKEYLRKRKINILYHFVIFVL